MQRTVEMLNLTQRYVEDMAIERLRSTGRAVALGDLLLFLQTICRDDALISRALSGLQTAKRIELGVDRHMRLVA